MAFAPLWHLLPMPTLDEHRRNLDRYRNLLAFTRDAATRELLKQLIQEAETAIKELDPDSGQVVVV